MKMWEFKTKRFSVIWSIEPDSDCDLSFDETGEVAEKIASGELECFTSTMEVIHRDSGAVLSTEYLGGSIYADPADFRDHIGVKVKSRQDGRNYGSYFSDMVRGAIGAARETIAEVTL